MRVFSPGFFKNTEPVKKYIYLLLVVSVLTTLSLLAIPIYTHYEAEELEIKLAEFHEPALIALAEIGEGIADIRYELIRSMAQRNLPAAGQKDLPGFGDLANPVESPLLNYLNLIDKIREDIGTLRELHVLFHHRKHEVALDNLTGGYTLLESKSPRNVGQEYFLSHDEERAAAQNLLTIGMAQLKRLHIRDVDEIKAAISKYRSRNPVRLSLILLAVLLIGAFIVQRLVHLVNRSLAERRLAEENIRTLNEDLENRVLERTKEIEQTIRQRDLILDAAGEGIYGVDLDGLGTFVNPAASELLGWEADEIIGKSNHDLMHHTHPDGTHCPRTESPIYRTFMDGHVHTVSDEVFWRKDETSFPVEYTSTPIYEDGEIMGAVVVFRDISEQRAIQEQLIQSSKMATLGEMATGVAHELNQPLNVIQLAAHNIKRKAAKFGQDTDYITGKLDKICGQVSRASEIIDHMRIFGRRTSAKTVLSLADSVTGVIGMVGQQLKLSNIALDVVNEDETRPVIGHQVQLEQVLLNLISNARDTLQERNVENPRILVTIENSTSDTVTLSVSDNGGGMAPEVLPRVFEPFYTTKEVGKGTGLGLSISYGIITDMDGAIMAENTPDGACFTIALPAHHEDTEAA
ncbi:MAG: PAS domain S-box protein [Alphaproteobacteria bacterium]|nr:PAS domain S-box protein [Alphaproteobacteria bacterium]